MKKHFFTGLTILAPIVLTLLLLIYLVNIFTRPFLTTVNTLFDAFGIFSSSMQLRQVISRVLILISLYAVLLLLGFIARLFVVRLFFQMSHALLIRIPFIKNIYTATKEAVQALVHHQNQEFSKVVLIPFPHSDARSIGLITNATANAEIVSVFLPAVPNPTMGFMLNYNRKDLIFLDMKVEDALTFIISCGIIPTKFSFKESHI